MNVVAFPARDLCILCSLPGGDEDAARATAEEAERQRRIDESLRKREAEVQKELSGHLRDRDKERQQHKHDEAVLCFNALLADLVSETTCELLVW